MGLDADVAQQDLVHRPLHADQHLGDLALGERVDPDAQMLHPLVELRDIGELPRQPVHGLGKNDIELARPCLALQGLDPGAEHAGSRRGAVMIGGGDLPAFAGGEIAAGLDLILDRGIALLVGRKAGVDRHAQFGLCHRVSPSRRKGSAGIGGMIAARGVAGEGANEVVEQIARGGILLC